MKGFISLWLALLMLAPNLAAAPHQAAHDADTWRRVATAIPLGVRVEVRMKQGGRFSGTLVAADEAGIVVKRRTRAAEEPRVVPYTSIVELERVEGGHSNIGKAIAIGLAAGAGAFLSMLAFAFAVAD